MKLKRVRDLRFLTKPWTIIDPALSPKLPAMLGGEEQQFLYWLGLESDDRPLVDLGTFLGASAASMAAGAQRAGSSSKVHSYDLFTYGPWCAPYGMGDGWNDGDDTLPWVQQQLGELRGRIGLNKGDICSQRWDGEPIGALFVDFTQNWHHHNHVCRAFLPHLRIGGVLAHQDYIYVVCYWLHVFMERYADHFEQMSPLIMNGTAAWRYVDPLPAEALAGDLQMRMTFSEMLELLERSIGRYEGTARDLLLIARGRFFLHARGPDAAQVECDELVRNNTNPLATPHIELFANEIPRWPRQGGPYQDFFRE